MSSSWTLADIERKAAAGKIVSYKVAGKGVPVAEKVKAPAAVKVAKKPIKLPAPEPKGVTFMKETLQRAGIEYQTEYYFAKPRMFRFDIAVPALKCAFEYEGIAGKGKSRHTTITGYSKDATKYNLAASLGWRVFRYTAINYEDFENDLKGIIG